MFPFKYFILKYSFWIVFNSKPGITKKKLKSYIKQKLETAVKLYLMQQLSMHGSHRTEY